MSESSATDMVGSEEHVVHVYRDAAGEWRWSRVAANGTIVADSGEGYVRRIDCITMAIEVNVGVPMRVEG